MVLVVYAFVNARMSCYVLLPINGQGKVVCFY